MDEQKPPSSTMCMEVNFQRYALKVGQIFILGKHTCRGKFCQGDIINVDEKDVDVKHCIVEVSVGEGIFICDLLSQSGTYLNGTRLTPLKKTLVQHGDVLRLGRAANIKFFNEEMETSHNSSGYGEAKKNTSDIICSCSKSSCRRGNFRVTVDLSFSSDISSSSDISITEDENDGQSDNALITSSTESLSSSESRLRSSSRLNKSTSAFVNKSAAKSNTVSIETDANPARKRKLQVPVQPLFEEKRIKRTISQVSKASPSKPTKAAPPMATTTEREPTFTSSSSETQNYRK